MINRILLAAFAIVAALVPAARAQDAGWTRYENPRFGYAIDLPLQSFEVVQEATNGDGLTLAEIGGDAELAVYGAYNVGGLSAAAFAAELEQADRIREVTYRAGGNSWFVRSGYYRREGDEREDLIFYAKFMFNADRSAISAFEISYPLRDRERLNALVTRIEKSMRSPD